jgi:hypothetical protein
MKVSLEMYNGQIVEHQCKLVMFRKVFGGYLFSDGEKEGDANYQVPENLVVGMIIEDDDYEEGMTRSAEQRNEADRAVADESPKDLRTED